MVKTIRRVVPSRPWSRGHKGRKRRVTSPAVKRTSKLRRGDRAVTTDGVETAVRDSEASLAYAETAAEAARLSSQAPTGPVARCPRPA